MCTWNSKMNTKEHIVNNQLVHALTHLVLPTCSHVQHSQTQAAMEFGSAGQPCQFSIWTTNALETIAQALRRMMNDEAVIKYLNSRMLKK